MIRKEYSGAVKESMTDADNFYVTFPHDADIAAKAVVLAAVFLLVRATRRMLLLLFFNFKKLFLFLYIQQL